MAIFDITYVGDMPYLKLTGGTVIGATTFTNNIAASTINGVTVGSDPKFTDTTYSVATTSANGLLPALGGGTTNYLRADGSWAKPPGTTYSVATTSANGLMAAADKTAVNKIGSGTLNTTNKTIIPAINELKAASSNVKVDYFPITAFPTSSNPITSAGGNFTWNYSSKTSSYEFIRLSVSATGRSTSSGATFYDGITSNSNITNSTTPAFVGTINPVGNQTIIGFSDNSNGTRSGNDAVGQVIFYPGKTMGWSPGSTSLSYYVFYGLYSKPTTNNWVVFTTNTITDPITYLLVFYI